MRDVANMTQNELTAIIFDGAEVYEFRSPASTFTADEIYAILDSPQFEHKDVKDD